MIAVAGATGALGSQICAALRRHGAEVRGLSRANADVTRELPSSVLDGVDVLVSTTTCFPRTDEIDAVDRDGNVRLIDAAERAGVGRVVFVSFKPVPLDFPLQRAKRAVEERLQTLDHVILRPGKLMDIWFSPLTGFDPAARTATLFGDGTAPVTWIAAADVAEIAARAALGAGSGVVELGGPEALSQREVIAIYEEATGEPWQVETLAVERLREMHEHGGDDVTRSLGALMLEAHLGATTETPAFLDTFPVRLTTVREFAHSPSG